VELLEITALDDARPWLKVLSRLVDAVVVGEETPLAEVSELSELLDEPLDEGVKQQLTVCDPDNKMLVDGSKEKLGRIEEECAVVTDKLLSMENVTDGLGEAATDRETTFERVKAWAEGVFWMVVVAPMLADMEIDCSMDKVGLKVE
jgi:hypothetical protein